MAGSLKIADAERQDCSAAHKETIAARTATRKRATKYAQKKRTFAAGILPLHYRLSNATPPTTTAIARISRAIFARLYGRLPCTSPVAAFTQTW